MDSQPDSSISSGLIEQLTMPAPAEKGSSPEKRPSRPRPTAGKHHHAFKQTFWPIILVMGVIMLGIGVWAIYTLTALTVGENPPLRKLACWMLLTLPVGLALILAAVIFFRDVKRVARGNSPGSQSALRRRS